MIADQLRTVLKTQNLNYILSDWNKNIHVFIQSEAILRLK